MAGFCGLDEFILQMSRAYNALSMCVKLNFDLGIISRLLCKFNKRTGLGRECVATVTEISESPGCPDESF